MKWNQPVLRPVKKWAIDVSLWIIHKLRSMLQPTRNYFFFLLLYTEVMSEMLSPYFIFIIEMIVHGFGSSHSRVQTVLLEPCFGSV